jgi:hypothetical protein
LLVPSGSRLGTAAYGDPGTGTGWQKKNATTTMPPVAIASTSKKESVLPGNSHEDSHEKKKALRPNAASGRAVAVPRWPGQLSAAPSRQHPAVRWPGESSPISSAPLDAQQPPTPVNVAQK